MNLVQAAILEQAKPMTTRKSRPVINRVIKAYIESNSMHGDVIAQLMSRVQKGNSVYGGTLCTHNGRRASVDALQEALDGFLYTTQLIMEQEHRDGRPANPVALKAAAYFFRACLCLNAIVAEEREEKAVCASER